MSKRKFALLALCAGLFVNLSFASTRKPGRNRNGLEGRSDLLLQGVLPLSTGGGASDGWNLLLSQGESSRGSLILGPGTPDNWNGGTGNWNSAGGWNNGVPGANSDVTIYSGGDDLVTLDTGASTINSLTLGGASNGSTSELTDVGITQTLTITQGLTIGQTGVLNLSGIGSAVTAGADSSNAGQIQLSNGSSLFINAD